MNETTALAKKLAYDQLAHLRRDLLLLRALRRLGFAALSFHVEPGMPLLTVEFPADSPGVAAAADAAEQVCTARIAALEAKIAAL